jgi:hypothetical protein
MEQRIVRSLRFALLCGAQAVFGWSQTPVSQSPATLAVPIVEVVSSPVGAAVLAAGTGYGSLGLGHIGWVTPNTAFGVTHSKTSNSFSMTTKLALLLSCPAADAGRRASIAAVLQQPDHRYVVSLDETTLSTAPVVISVITTCGSTTQHTLSINVPVSSTAGPINANLSFQVTLK